ncbi:MAG: 2-dehydropantoate 2-reductase [Phycisphaerales bacterium]|nr:MAG: 2-dehydropantoate 2-reductase [Phycisphaerales bacterium]
MRVAVFGVGAVGGYFGGRLARRGNAVIFIARGETLRALRRDGLRVDSPNGDIHLPEVEATDAIEKVGAVDAVLVTVKAWQVPEAAEAIRPLVTPRTAILPLQNGVEAADQLAEVHGRQQVLAGTCGIVAMKVAPGHVKHVGVDPFIALGHLDNHSSEQATALLETLLQAGIGAHIPDDIHTSIWKKFLFIAPVSGVGAVARAPLGVVRSVPETRELIVEAMREVSALAAAKEITLPADAVEKATAFLDDVAAEATSSMQRDIMEGRPSELESINGAVVRIGQAVNVPTPVNRFIYASLLPMEREAREHRKAS